MFKKGLAISTVVAAAMLCVLLITTTPLSTGPLGILGFFVFMYITALGMLSFLFRGVSVFIHKAIPHRRSKFAGRELNLKQSYYYASVVALAPVMLIAMQSVGEIGLYQLLLVGFFVIVAWLYVTNRTA